MPGRVLQQTTTLSTYLNENVETDNLFVYKYIINHFVDRCTRWHAGGIITAVRAPGLVGAGPAAALDGGADPALAAWSEKGVTRVRLAQKCKLAHAFL